VCATQVVAHEVIECRSKRRRFRSGISLHVSAQNAALGFSVSP
jgi:hypothetical protein